MFTTPRKYENKDEQHAKDMKMYETSCYDLDLSIQRVRMHKNKIFTMKTRKDANFITQNNKTRDFACKTYQNSRSEY